MLTRCFSPPPPIYLLFLEDNMDNVPFCSIHFHTLVCENILSSGCQCEGMHNDVMIVERNGNQGNESSMDDIIRWP